MNQPRFFACDPGLSACENCIRRVSVSIAISRCAANLCLYCSAGESSERIAIGYEPSAVLFRCALGLSRSVVVVLLSWRVGGLDLPRPPICSARMPSRPPSPYFVLRTGHRVRPKTFSKHLHRIPQRGMSPQPATEVSKFFLPWFESGPLWEWTVVRHAFGRLSLFGQFQCTCSAQQGVHARQRAHHGYRTVTGELSAGRYGP